MVHLPLVNTTLTSVRFDCEDAPPTGRMGWSDYQGWYDNDKKLTCATLLLAAIMHGDLDAMMRLIEHPDVNLNLGYRYKPIYTPIIAAVGLLIPFCFVLRSPQISQMFYLGHTAGLIRGLASDTWYISKEHKAARQKEVMKCKIRQKDLKAIVPYLLEKGVFLAASPFAQTSALEQAMRLRDISLVKKVFTRGRLDPNEVSGNKSYHTPLLVASLGLKPTRFAGRKYWPRSPLPRKVARRQNIIVSLGYSSSRMSDLLFSDEIPGQKRG